MPQRLIFSDCNQTQLGRFVLDQADVLIFAIDFSGKLLFANGYALNWLGWTLEEVGGRDFFMTLCAEADAERLGRLILGDSPVLPTHSRIELRSRNGVLHSFYCSASANSLAEGRREIVLIARPEGEIAPRTLLDSDSAALALFQNAPHAIFLHDAGLGRIFQANEQALSLSASQREEVLGREMHELLPYLRHSEFEKSLGGESVDTSLRSRNGRLTPVSVTGSRVMIDGIERWLTFVRDLSRERRAETERIASEARFKTALDRLMDGFCLLAPTRDSAGAVSDFKFTYANPSARESLRIPSGETDKHSLLGVFDLPTGEKLREMFAGVMRSGRDVNVDRIRLGMPTGSAVYALHACRHGDGLAVSLRDETERSQNEQALASKERSQSALLAHLPVGVYYVDLDAPNAPVLNQSAMELLGESSRTMDFRTCCKGQLFEFGGQAVPTEDLPFNRVLRTGKDFRNDRLELRRQDAPTVRLDLAVSAVREGGGRIVAMVAVFNDITDRISLESQLSQSQRMQALGTLAGGIAHDFNNIAQAISGSLELAKRTLTPDHAAFGSISAAQKAAARVTSLTVQLLSASRQKLEALQTASVAPLVQETSTLLRSSIDKRISIVTQIPDLLWPAVLESGRFQQSVLNLALNARDAIAGNGIITISAKNVSLAARDPELGASGEPGDYVAISVSDTGSGIPAEVLGRIFEPFYSTKPLGKGTGLGLSVVYANMQQVGGWVRVHSSPAGSSFVLYFRRGQRFSRKIELDEPEFADDVTDSGTEHILVVDDEPEILEIASEILTDMGYAVEIAADGVMALDRLRKQRDIDLVLLDLTMPRLSGAETLKAIRTENLAPCVVVMSGFAGGLETEDLIKLGADAFLPKPYSLSQMTKTVREQLNLRRKRGR